MSNLPEPSRSAKNKAGPSAPFAVLRWIRPLIRDLLTALAVLATAPLWISARLALRLGLGDGCFASCAELLSLFPDLFGVFLRRGFYVMCCEHVARDCSIGFGTCFAHPQLRIERAVYIGGRCTIGVCDIGENSLIGDNVDILSGRHQHHSEDRSAPRNKQGRTFAAVRIGRNVWIGNSAVIMADVGDDSVVGAGSVVVKAIPSGCIAAGNPATVKKTLDLASLAGVKETNARQQERSQSA